MKPILFNTEMVKAILNNSKTTTRRVIKPHYRDGESGFQVVTRRNGEFVRVEKVDENECGIFADGTEHYVNPPYLPGDILYVRETYSEIEIVGHPETRKRYYRADGNYPDCIPWRPSIFMPKEAARIFLKVTDVKAERLQDITNAGAFAEGCNGRGLGPNSGCDGSLSTEGYDFSIEKFETIWDSTIKKSDIGRYGWDANPWVWVISFKKLEDNFEEK